MLLDDLVHIGLIEIAIPDAFRIDHGTGPELAAVQTAGLVDAQLALAQQAQRLGFFLGVYFLAGCIFIGMWKKLAQKHGMIKIWITSLIGSVVTFIFNCLLGETTADLFFIVCFASGMFLGADLIP